ncbi:MAG: hypothetical protein GY697_00485 [Desulfobacterales bacterium]|nr:hypothetical protein [Desulfobacterales bacterium]
MKAVIRSLMLFTALGFVWSQTLFAVEKPDYPQALTFQQWGKNIGGSAKASGDYKKVSKSLKDIERVFGKINWDMLYSDKKEFKRLKSLINRVDILDGRAKRARTNWEAAKKVPKKAKKHISLVVSETKAFKRELNGIVAQRTQDIDPKKQRSESMKIDVPHYPETLKFEQWRKRKGLVAKIVNKNTGIGQDLKDIRSAFSRIDWDKLYTKQGKKATLDNLIGKLERLEKKAKKTETKWRASKTIPKKSTNYVGLVAKDAGRFRVTMEAIRTERKSVLGE